MTLLVFGKPCLLRTLPHAQVRQRLLNPALLLASLTILAPVASARQCGSTPANLAFDPIPSLQPWAHSSQITDSRDLAAFGYDNFDAGALSGHRDRDAPSASPHDGGAIASEREANLNCGPQSPATPSGSPRQKANAPPSENPQSSELPDFNRDIYYKNKFEFSLDGGWLPINIPLPFDFFSGDPYNTYPLKYTLVPIIASLRWHMTDIGGPWVLRGNWDFQFSGSVTAVARGPETRYLVYLMGMRRNFVPRNSRVAPYFDVRVGAGNIDAKGPVGIYYAQGDPITFTFIFGSGVRYNFNPRYAISAGVNYMHISNGNISQVYGYTNYGINVVGPMVGLDIQLRRHRR